MLNTLKRGVALGVLAGFAALLGFAGQSMAQDACKNHGDLDALLQLAVRSADGKLVPIRELVTVSDTLREQPIYHKDLLPVNFVVADMAGQIDSPLYGMFDVVGQLADLPESPDSLNQYFISQPELAYRNPWETCVGIVKSTFTTLGRLFDRGSDIQVKQLASVISITKTYYNISEDIRRVLQQESRWLNDLLDDAKVPCWAPDAPSGREPCRVQ